MEVQGQRLSATDTVCPPAPPKPIRAPFTLKNDSALRLTRGPFRSERVLPLSSLKRSPVTRSTLPPAKPSAPPWATVRALRSGLTRKS
jgi:hypothetical protein